MNAHSRTRAGFTLPEIVVALVLIALLLTAAAPRFQRSLQAMRVRAALDQVVGELYRARMAAVGSGRPVHLVLRSSGGCITAVRSTTGPLRGDVVLSTRRLELPGLCLRHSGDSLLIFNARGMLRPPARSVFARQPTTGDSVLISIAGRVRRSY